MIINPSDIPDSPIIIDEKKRSKEIWDFAADHFFHFRETETIAYPQFVLFSNGNGPQIRNHIYKTIDRVEVEIFDHRYREEPGVLTQTVMCFWSKEIPFRDSYYTPGTWPILYPYSGINLSNSPDTPISQNHIRWPATTTPKSGTSSPRRWCRFLTCTRGGMSKRKGTPCCIVFRGRGWSQDWWSCFLMRGGLCFGCFKRQGNKGIYIESYKDTVSNRINWMKWSITWLSAILYYE